MSPSAPRESGAGNSNNSPLSKASSFPDSLQLQEFMHDPPDRAPRRSARQAASASMASATNTAKPVSAKKRRQTSPPSQGEPQRLRSGYAPPSTYAHLPLLPDTLAENLLVLFVGLNPGIQTARTGHAYAHPSNRFWKFLYSSGITPRPCRAEEDRSMPRLYALGHTNIVARPSRNGAELSKQEMDDGVAVLENKVRKWRPESVCVVGKSIWESIWRVRHVNRPLGKKAFQYGWQEDGENMGVVPGEWAGARVFVASSTSGLAATLSTAQKQEIWNELGTWVKTRRAERTVAEEPQAKGKKANNFPSTST